MWNIWALGFKMAEDWDSYISLKSAAMRDDRGIVFCLNRKCGHSAELLYKPLIDKFGRDCGLGRILRNLRCTKCGHLGASIRSSSYDKLRPWRPLFCSIRQHDMNDCIAGKCDQNCAEQFPHEPFKNRT